jgi:predicted GNAT family acetyltransferase
METMPPIHHIPESERFEMHIEGKLAVVEYRGTAKRVAFTHTEVPIGLEGRGVGTALARHVLGWARENQLEVVPLCPFIRAFVQRHRKEYADIVPAEYLD